MTPQHWLRTVQRFRYTGMSRNSPIKEAMVAFASVGPCKPQLCQLALKCASTLVFFPIYLSVRLLYSTSIWADSRTLALGGMLFFMSASSIYISQGFVMTIGTFSRRSLHVSWVCVLWVLGMPLFSLLFILWNSQDWFKCLCFDDVTCALHKLSCAARFKFMLFHDFRNVSYCCSTAPLGEG